MSLVEEANQIPKKRKVEDSNPNHSKDGIIACPSVFDDFKVVQILREDSNSKLVTLQGIFQRKISEDEKGDADSTESSPAVVILERKAFDVSSIQQSLSRSHTTETLKNDIYSTQDVFSSSIDADTKATIIYPATEKHIAKYSEHEPYIIRETGELYKSVTLPCLENSHFSVQWVYNILEKKTEADRIVMEDTDPETGFIIVPDMKWDRKNVNNLYLVTLINKHGIKSLRDLRKEHLPLLKNIQSKGLKAVKDLYGLTSDKVRMFFHYQPSYYHLHVHITNVKWDPPGFHALRAHMLEDVIENIEWDSEFYDKKSMSYIVRDNDQLYRAYKDSGYFNEIKADDNASDTHDM